MQSSWRPPGRELKLSENLGATAGVGPNFRIVGAEYIVEVPVRSDASPRVHVRGAGVADVAALARVLRGEGSSTRDQRAPCQLT